MPLQIQMSLTSSCSSSKSLLLFSSRLPSLMPSILAGQDETSTTSSLLPGITTSSSSMSTLDAVPLQVHFFPFFKVRHSLDESLSVDSSLPLADFGHLPPLSFDFVPFLRAFFVCKASFDAAAFCVCHCPLPDFWSIVRVVMIGSFTTCSTSHLCNVEYMPSFTQHLHSQVQPVTLKNQLWPVAGTKYMRTRPVVTSFGPVALKIVQKTGLNWTFKHYWKRTRRIYCLCWCRLG